ncbi:alpha-glucan phosphorylase [Thermincola ferriacetica]|uniref:glycogen phosphorylase n=2 Tax=Thermincola ferriacetica TaxID=281456 RepID=A0A0L6W5Z6_9FIRM|nr:alpha-glucan family phosphorylase [Thermincola ferriacetica]KNZ70997.1 alpha-glucan phosphorylase [Thermincola ferriacetica]
MAEIIKRQPKVAYFCMEYGLSHELPIYAGGLGVLAGDFLKAAHDLNLPVVGIGILWRQDYTEQFIGEDGRPYDLYPDYDYSNIKDTGKTVTVRIRGEDVICKIRLVDQYANAPLYLLDTNYPGSPHGWITNRLYGGTAQDRIAQEMVLGIGGIRALKALGIEVDVYHFNEGHAVFAGIELIREKMHGQHMSFEDAWQETRRQVCFTTHTPVAAGNESHDHALLQHMEAYNGLNHEQMSKLGGDPFNMTAAALRLSTVANAVSKLHGQTARSMWKEVRDAAPIISITNGVHTPTWQADDIKEAFERGEDLWEPHMRHKKELLAYIKEQTGNELNPDALLVGFARRAAAYKRSDLIFRNAEVIEPLLKEGKIQLVFSGKAHPRDTLGKEIITDLVKMDRKYSNSVVFLENYNMNIARLLVRGSDVWLNNPKRPLEASGTSGMKAAMNGVLNVSVVDGWVAEGCQHGVSGWLICTVCKEPLTDINEDELDVQNLYRVLFDEVIPTYYNNREKWLEMMRASIDMSHYQFSAQRMIREYYELLYNRTYREQEKKNREPAMV